MLPHCLKCRKNTEIKSFFCHNDSVKSRRIFKPQHTRYLTTTCLLFI